MGATQVVEPDVEAQAPPRRGSALAAVAIVTGIALVAAGLVVAWARFGGPASTTPEPQVIDSEPPASLAGGLPLGEVPPPIAAAVAAPVVAAARLDTLPADLQGCGEDVGMTDERLESAIITPDAAIVAMIGAAEGFGPVQPVPLPAPVPDGAAAAAPPPEVAAAQVRASCAGSWDGGWTLTSSNVASVGEFISSMGGNPLPDGSLLALTTVLVPEGATWLVHDRGGYRLAYPVAGLASVTVTVPQRGSGAFGSGLSSTPATFLDDGGTVLEETFVRA